MHLPSLLSRLNIEQSLGAAKNSIKRSCLSLCSSSPSNTYFFGMQTAKPITPPPTSAVPAYLPHWLSACWLNTGGKWNCCESCRTGQGTANVELVFLPNQLEDLHHILYVVCIYTNWSIYSTQPGNGCSSCRYKASPFFPREFGRVLVFPFTFFRGTSRLCSIISFQEGGWVNAFLWG